VRFSHRGERHYSQAGGLLGGEAGAFARSEIRRRDGRVEEIRSKIVTTLEAGDRVYIMTPGGGGYGEAAKRDRAAIERDVSDGKVSAEHAGAAYGH
jgi:N-methylhydantoinase B/oxoprolinase/acetone carboxylase alpha subunit